MSKTNLDVVEAEYSELISIPGIFKNFRYGLKINTNKDDYEDDMKMLVAQVRKDLQEIIADSKRQNEEKKKRK